MVLAASTFYVGPRRILMSEDRDLVWGITSTLHGVGMFSVCVQKEQKEQSPCIHSLQDG